MARATATPTPSASSRSYIDMYCMVISLVTFQLSISPPLALGWLLWYGTLARQTGSLTTKNCLASSLHSMGKYAMIHKILVHTILFTLIANAAGRHLNSQCFAYKLSNFI